MSKMDREIALIKKKLEDIEKRIAKLETKSIKKTKK